MTPKFWMRRLNIGPAIRISVVYNTTFNMTDGPIRFYRDRDDDIGIRVYSIRIGHLWLNLDVVA